MASSSQFIKLIDPAEFREQVPAGSRLLVAVSGGADSVAMLFALLELTRARDYIVSVVHVNHGLRLESHNEQKFVEELCARLKITVHVCHVCEKKESSSLSPEQFWRKLRYGQFVKVLDSTKSDFVCLGHTLDDLAETFLFHLTRGTGVEGLVFSFLKAADDLAVLRPLWKTERSQIEESLKLHDQEWVSDSSNSDIRYSRNLIRNSVMPLLRKINPGACRAIFNASQDLQNRLRDGDKDGPEASGIDISDRVFLDLFDLKDLDVSEIAVRMRDFVKIQAGNPMNRRQTMQGVDMVRLRKPGFVALTGKKTLVITQEHGWVYPGDQPSDTEIAKFFTDVKDGFSALVPHDHSGDGPPYRIIDLNGEEWSIDWKPARFVKFRNRLPGDRIGSKLLARLLIDCKIPWFLRDFTVVAEDTRGEITGVLILNEEYCAPINRRIGSNLSFCWNKIKTKA